MTPQSIILYVTSRCNMKCAHCFYWSSLNKNNEEILVEDCKKLALSLRHPIALSITGGEPMLRRDLAELVKSFTDQDKVKELSMASNGYFTEASVEFCTRFCQENPQVPLSVQLSLDGLAATHESIRGVAGSFTRAMSTLERLRELESLQPGFSVSVGIAVQKSNLAEMEELLELLGGMGVKIRINLVRGETSGTFGVSRDDSSHFDPREGSAIVLHGDELRFLYGLLQEKNLRYGFWSKRHQRIFEIGMETVERKRKLIDCYAGTIDAVVYANGDVSFCELTGPVGNLYHYDFDLHRLWNDARAVAMRAKVGSCFCTHGCNLSTSLMFDPEMVMEAVSDRMVSEGWGR